MSNLTWTEKEYELADVGAESVLPNLEIMKNGQQRRNVDFGEDEELFLGYGFLKSAYPYKMQDRYRRDLKKEKRLTAVLENRYLRAEFLPNYGGRLWSLYDKVQKKDLLYTNEVIRPSNLAVRDAWFSGGAEWNCGFIGHGPFTCVNMFSAELKNEDGDSVLRFYEYERIREIFYQIDFWLPEDSEFLLMHVRIVNPHFEVVPMYWWSNIAVCENPASRVIVDAEESYACFPKMERIPVPYRDGVDITYPVHTRHAEDFFWKLRKNSRKFIGYVDENGYGLLQASTDRLQGRKLFVWGQGAGSRNWQRVLTKDGSDASYVEIQAGLAKTQYECIPMPPRTAWEWTECYGAVQTDPQKAHGDWKDARAEMIRCLDRKLPKDRLEQIYAGARKTAKMRAEKVMLSGSGWGALETLRQHRAGGSTLSEHLDFGTVTDEQKPWQSLLENGRLGDTHYHTWMIGQKWIELLEEAVRGADAENPQTLCSLACAYIVTDRIEEAKPLAERAMALTENEIVLYTASAIYKRLGELDRAIQLLEQANKICPDCDSLAREYAALLDQAECYPKMLAFLKNCSRDLMRYGLFQFYQAKAYLKTGHPDLCEKILTDPEFSLEFIREGEVSVTDLWIELQKCQGKEPVVPDKFNYRMNEE